MAIRGKLALIGKPLTPSEIDQAADSVFLWLSFYLFLALVSVYKVWRSIIFVATDEPLQERFTNATKVFLAITILFGLQIMLFASSDVFQLSLAFPFWGGLVFVLIVLIFGIVGLSFWLNREDLNEYTIKPDLRSEIDAEWKRRSAAKRNLQRMLIAWIAGDAVAIVWLMSLTGKSWRSLFNF